MKHKSWTEGGGSYKFYYVDLHLILYEFKRTTIPLLGTISALVSTRHLVNFCVLKV